MSNDEKTDKKAAETYKKEKYTRKRHTTRRNQHVLTCFACERQIKLINDTTPNVISKN